LSFQQLQLLQGHRQLSLEHMGRAPVDVMHHHQLYLWWLPADLLQQFTPERLFRRLTWIEVAAK
jgi:hypothetical protein